VGADLRDGTPRETRLGVTGERAAVTEFHAARAPCSCTESHITLRLRDVILIHSFVTTHGEMSLSERSGTPR